MFKAYHEKLNKEVVVKLECCFKDSPKIAEEYAFYKRLNSDLENKEKGIPDIYYWNYEN